jgi:hypothetical protein
MKVFLVALSLSHFILEIVFFCHEFLIPVDIILPITFPSYPVLIRLLQVVGSSAKHNSERGLFVVPVQNPR